MPKRQFVTFRRFAPRLPMTIWKWNVEDGDLVSITQHVFKDRGYTTVDIPAEERAADVVVYTNKRRGDEFTGRSSSVPPYKAWTFKELIEKVAASRSTGTVSASRSATPRGREERPGADGPARDILKNLRSGAFSYIVAPGPKRPRNATATSSRSSA
jgi:hypothetical protein